MKFAKLFEKFQNYLVGDFKDDDVRILQTSIYILRFFRLLPQKGKGAISKYELFQAFICVTFNLSTAVMNVHYMDNLDYVLDDVLTSLSIILSAINFGLIIIVFLLNYRSFLLLANSLSNDIYAKPRKLEERNNFINFVFRMYIVYAIISVLLYTAAGLLNIKDCQDANEELGLDRICGLVTIVQFPSACKDFPYFQIVMSLQMLHCFVIVLLGSTIVFLVGGFMEILITHVEELKENLQSAFNNANPEMQRKQLKHCINYHVFIIQLTQQLNKSAGVISFQLATATSAVIAVVLYQCLLIPQVKTLLHAGGWLMLLFVYCFFGQRLIDKTEGISLSIYSSEWFSGNLELQKYVLIIIMRSNYELNLDASGFGKISFSTFATGVQSAYSFLALLYNSGAVEE